MQTRQQLMIIDSRGQATSIEINVEHQFLRHLLWGSGDAASPRFTSHRSWRSLSPGALSAPRGHFFTLWGGGDNGAARTYHLDIGFIGPRGINCRLLLLKRWFTNNGCESNGVGTLYPGVSLGLQPGEVRWSEMSHHRIIGIVADINVIH